MKNIFLFILFVVCNISYSQEYGLIQGLSVEVPYDKMIEDYRYNSNAIRQAYLNFKQRYENNLQSNYFNAVPKIQPTSGWAEAIVTNEKHHVHRGQVYIENSVIVKFEDSNNKYFSVTAGGKLEDFRSIVNFGTSESFEVILLMIMQK